MQGNHRWRFGPFEVDAREHRLSKDGQAVALTRKGFALLLALLRRPGELVTKSELFAVVWPGVVVTDAALSQAIHELRAALGDSATAPRFIATVHGLGFRFMASAAPQSLERADAGARADGRCLVGRAADLQRLDDGLSAAHGGQRRLIFVTGEAGIGKTALIEAFVERHASDHLWVAQGRCIEQYGPGEAHLPILEALEQLARQADTAAFVDVFSRYAPSWLALLPWLAREARAAAAAETTPERMLRELAHALDTLSQQRTIVLWLEDLHWSDPSSLELLAFVAGRRDPARLLLVGSLRHAEAAGDTPLGGIMLRLLQRGQADEMALQPLSYSDTARYLGLRLGRGDGAVVDDLAATVHRRSEGNPLFIVSLVDDLMHCGELVVDDGGWRFAGGAMVRDDRLPDSLRRLVHAQIEQLSEDDRRCVEAAAVAGTSFSAAAAAAALQASEADTEDRCLRLALQGRLLERQPAVSWPDGSVSSGFRFLHALYWQGADERVPEGRRAEWQHRIGLRLEQAFGATCTGIATELALRFEAARDIERSLRYRRMAGSAALSRCAYPESIEQLRHGLRLVAALPAEQRPRHELDLLLPLGAALMAAQGYASRDVEAVYDRALALCRNCGEPQDLMRALRGQWNVAFLRADLAAAGSTAQQLLAQAESLGDAEMRVDALTKLGETCLHQGDLRAARLHLEAAFDSSVASATRAGLRGAPRVAAYLAWVLWYSGEPRRAAEVGDTALDLARCTDSPHSRAFAQGYVSWVRLMRGEIEQAQALTVQQVALCNEYGLAYWRQLAEFMEGAVMTRQGKAAGGIDRMRHATDEMQASGGKVGVPCLLCIVAEAQLAAGRRGDARAAVAAASELIASTGNALYAAEVRRLQGLVARAEDDGPTGREAARRSFEAAIEIAREQGASALELRAATNLAGLLAEDGDLRRAVDLLASARSAFSDGSESEDLARADALLASLRAGSTTLRASKSG